MKLFTKNDTKSVEDESRFESEKSYTPTKEFPMVSTKKESAMNLKSDDITTILGKGSEFEGKLQFEGELRIEGVFSGEIHSDSVLVVGDSAKISAEVDVGTIIVNGEVRGNIKARQGIEIRNPGKLIGNIQTPSLIIEKGVLFDGSCKMQDLGASSKPVTSAFSVNSQKQKKEEDVKKNVSPPAL